MAAQAPDLTRPARAWVEDAAKLEEAVVDHRGVSVRYLSHRIDARGDTLRDSIDSTQGTVARMIQRNGKPLTAEEDAAERARLEAVLRSPAEFYKHHRHDDEERHYTLEMVRLMPQAMLYSYVSGQPQLTDASEPQVVLDFKPDPAFHPPSTAAQLLTGFEGRMWIDARTHHMMRLEATVTHQINLGWGLLARIYPGGKVTFEQTDAGNGTWVYSHLEQQVTLRELIVKTQQVQMNVTGSAFSLLPAMSWQGAIHRLLDTPAKH